MTFRFLAGLGIGGMLVVDPAMLTEYLPPQRRGRLLVFLDFWWPVGLLLATGLSWIFIGHSIGGDSSWRWLFLAASFPAFLAFFARRSLPESPYFLARRGRDEEAAEVLTEITGKPVKASDFTAPEETESSARELVEPRCAAERLTTALDLDRAQHLLLRPVPLAPVRAPGREELLDQRVPAADPERALAVPGLRGGDLARRADRAQADPGGFLILGGISAYAFAVADSESVYVTALFFVGFFNLGAWGAVYPYTAELFPTRLRSTAFGVMEGVGKTAAIAGPYIFGNLKDATGSTTWSLTFVAIVMAAGGIVAAVFGRETRGHKLA